MKLSGYLLGAYQVIGAFCSLMTLWSAMSARGIGALVALVLLSGVAVAAGVSLWRGSARGWQLTILNQLLQVLGIYGPWFSFAVIHGASATIATRCFAKATFGDSIFTTSALFTMGDSVCDVGSLANVSGVPTYGVSLNLLALGVMVYAMVARNRANQAPEPTPLLVTDRADARSAPSKGVAHL